MQIYGTQKYYEVMMDFYLEHGEIPSSGVLADKMFVNQRTAYKHLMYLVEEGKLVKNQFGYGFRFTDETLLELTKRRLDKC